MLAAEEALGEALAPEAPEQAAASVAEALLRTLSAAARAHGALLGPGSAAQGSYALGLALLEPLQQLVGPLLACLQGRPPLAQVRRRERPASPLLRMPLWMRRIWGWARHNNRSCAAEAEPVASGRSLSWCGACLQLCSASWG